MDLALDLEADEDNGECDGEDGAEDDDDDEDEATIFKSNPNIPPAPFPASYPRLTCILQSSLLTCIK